MPVSCVFILLTVAVYVFVPELLNLNGLVLIAYLLSLFVGFCLLTAREYLGAFKKMDNLTSLILTFLIYFTMMVTFFWLNVICYDVWAGFRSKIHGFAHQSKGSTVGPVLTESYNFSGSRGNLVGMQTKWRRFSKYSQYAFGVPIAMTVLLISLEFSGYDEYSYMPQIRKQHYRLIGPPRYIYFYGPLTILCSANITFFTLTILRIIKVKRETGMLLNGDFHSHRIDKDRFFIYIKLFVIMGINWLLEVIGVIYEGPTEVWEYTDIYNIFTGLAIFLLFVCKKNTLKLFKKRYYPRTDSSLRFQTSITKVANSKDRVLLRTTTISSEN
ncbi:G-protein coupled receptor Mth2 [Eumeta japonica]|uniref:G-protein coupled receptor Mth2 n=1 Tax=Eumeta variegata TaxID=151549 RepID=A0A4C1W626_EUMVA|nr:G-protein coupled receptor Mth2 [Eumeta japonica]